MHEALIEMVKLGWHRMHLDYIEATVEQVNVRSQRLLLKLNFIKAVELKDNLFYYTLKKEDSICDGYHSF